MITLFFGKLSRRARAWLQNHAPKVRVITNFRIFTDTRAVAFKLKELVLFFVCFLMASFAITMVNQFYPITSGEGIIGGLIAVFVPVLLFYVVWKNWGEKASEA